MEKVLRIEKRNKEHNSIEKEIDDELEVIKKKPSRREIDEELDVIKENLQRKKLYSIEKEIDDEYNVIKRRFLRKIFKKRK